MTVAEMTASNQYLAFRLDSELFAVGVDKIREIIDFTTVTKVPRTPESMRGVINLRGNVVPVIDMRAKFEVLQGPDTVDTCIVVLEVSMDEETTIIGALVDSVKEVFDMEADMIEPPPKIGTNLSTDFILGMGQRDNDFIIILDVDRVFSTEELLQVHRAGQMPAAEPEQT